METLFEFRHYFITKDTADKQKKASFLYADNNENVRTIFDYVRDELIRLECTHTKTLHCFIVIQMFMVNEKMIKIEKKSKTQETIVNEKYKLEFDSDSDTGSDSDSDSDSYSDTDEEEYESDTESEL